MPLSASIGNAAEFVEQDGILRPGPGWAPVLGLVGICILVGRPIDNRPQVANLPHIKPRARLNQYRCPVVGKVSGIEHARRRDTLHS